MKYDIYEKYDVYNQIHSEGGVLSESVLQQNISDCSDAELTALVREGSEPAFEIICERYSPLISSIASGYSVAGLDKNDFIQEGMLALLSASRSYREDRSTSFRTYAGVCITRRFLSLIKKSGNKSTVPSDALVSLDELDILESDRSNPETVLLEKESSDALKKAITDRLSDFELSVLRHYLRAWSYSEIADKLGVSIKSVDNALQRIRKKIAGA